MTANEKSSSAKEPISYNKKCLIVEGGPGTGKTAFVLNRILQLIASGEASSGICVIMPSQAAADEFAKRISVNPELSGVLICTAYDLAMRILDTPEAISKTGRVPRVLNSFEEKIFLEDMRTTQMKPRRLREMLKFFYHQWSEMADDDPQWLISDEERNLNNNVGYYLITHKAMLLYELSNIAVNYLRNFADALEDNVFNHVFVDDFIAQSKATQTLCSMLAQKSLTVTGDINLPEVQTDPYPHLAGFEDLRLAYQGTETIHLQQSARNPQTICAMANALAFCDGLSENNLVEINASLTSGKTINVRWDTPTNELEGLTTYIAKKLSVGTGDTESPDILILAPNKTWARRFTHKLRAANLDVRCILHTMPLSGNPYVWEKCYALRYLTALNLCAKPDDVIAWRVWCGLGHDLTNSDAWLLFEQWCHENNLTHLHGLKTLATEKNEPFPKAGTLASAYTSGKNIIEDCIGRKGFSLLNGIKDPGKKIPDEVLDLLGIVSGNESAQELYNRATKQLLEPSFLDTPKPSIHICDYESSIGLEAATVIMPGLIDGFLPNENAFSDEVLAEKQDKFKEAGRRTFHYAITRSSNELILSSFWKEVFEHALAQRMYIKRIRAEGNNRIAILSPSSYIADLADTVPGMVSGNEML